MLAVLDRVIDKVVPRETAGACIPPEPCGCGFTNSYICSHGLRYRIKRNGGNSNCLGNCSYTGSICDYWAVSFC